MGACGEGIYKNRRNVGGTTHFLLHKLDRCIYYYCWPLVKVTQKFVTHLHHFYIKLNLQIYH